MRRSITAFAAGLVTAVAVLSTANAENNGSWSGGSATATPIKHLVVIFQENVSFDHYFGTYPRATNPSGEPHFEAAPGTPTVNGLRGTLLSSNPNATNPVNGTGATNPFRLDRSQAATNDQDHDYTPEQLAFDHGLMDAFPASVGTAGPPPTGTPIFATTGLTMGYYDGNTVTALWNYAQHFAMSDNSYDTNFGPSTPGAINLVSGQTNGVTSNMSPGGATIPDGNGGLSLISDADPLGDVCSTTTGELVHFSGKNIGDLLNAAGVTWGFFEGGFDLTVTNSNGSTGCKRSTTSTVTKTNKADYIPHHQPFQYYTSTANLTHARPKSVHSIGQTDGANHQYDTHDFFDAVNAGNFPAVVFLKAPGFQDGHAGYSDPLDEQTFIVNTINFLQKQRDWESTAVVIAYDDSDGWYDHAAGTNRQSVRDRRGRVERSWTLRQRRWRTTRRHPGDGACAGPLRLRPAVAPAGDLALGAQQFRRSHHDRPVLDHPFRRRQLAAQDSALGTARSTPSRTRSAICSTSIASPATGVLSSTRTPARSKAPTVGDRQRRRISR